MINPGSLALLLVFAPFVAFLIYATQKARRKAAQIEREGPVPMAPLDSTPAAVRGFSKALLMRLPEPKRQYLSEQLAVAFAGVILVGWPLTVVLSTALVPSSVGQNRFLLTTAAAVWYTYLKNVSAFASLAGVAAALTGFLAVATFLSGSPATFYRTRPMTRAFLFRTRIACALATLFTAATVAILISLGLVLVFYGPVWLHLRDGGSGAVLLPVAASHPITLARGLSRYQLYQVLALLDTSAPRIFLSFLTSLTLIFSAAVALVSQPFGAAGKFRTASPIFLVVAILLGSLISRVFTYLPHSRWANFLFLYLRLGPPPPYAFALVPLLLSAALLLFAQFLIVHREA